MQEQQGWRTGTKEISKRYPFRPPKLQAVCGRLECCPASEQHQSQPGDEGLARLHRGRYALQLLAIHRWV